MITNTKRPRTLEDALELSKPPDSILTRFSILYGVDYEVVHYAQGFDIVIGVRRLSDGLLHQDKIQATAPVNRFAQTWHLVATVAERTANSSLN